MYCLKKLHVLFIAKQVTSREVNDVVKHNDHIVRHLYVVVNLYFMIYLG